MTGDRCTLTRGDRSSDWGRTWPQPPASPGCFHPASAPVLEGWRDVSSRCSFDRSPSLIPIATARSPYLPRGTLWYDPNNERIQRPVSESRQHGNDGRRRAPSLRQGTTERGDRPPRGGRVVVAGPGGRHGSIAGVSAPPSPPVNNAGESPGGRGYSHVRPVASRFAKRSIDTARLGSPGVTTVSRAVSVPHPRERLRQYPRNSDENARTIWREHQPLSGVANMC